MVIRNGILFLSAKDLLKYGFTQNFLDKQTSTGNYPSLYGHDPNQPHRKEVRLIAFDDIPEATRASKNMPPKEQLLLQLQDQTIASLVTFNTEAYNHYLANPATNKIAKQKAEQDSWMLAIACAKSGQYGQLGFAGKDEFYQAAIAAMQATAHERNWHAWKLSTLNELRSRLTPFKKYLKGEITLAEVCNGRISKKTGTSNAQKMGIDQQALLVQMYADGNAKPNFEQVYMIYMRKAQEMINLGHWTPKESIISPSTVRAFLMKPAIRQLWFEARHGHQEYRNLFEPVTMRERATYANALWVIDGTPSHRYFQHGDKGRYFRFNIFPILDAHSWCVLGFWLSETENTDAVLGALRSACMVTGHMPHQVLYDNSSAIQSYRAQEAIDKISVVSFGAQAGNARAKIIENFFHLFNQDVQKFRPGYTANPFALRLDNRANREALAALVKSEELPRAELALKQVIEDLTIWNNTPRKFLGNTSPLATYRKSVAETAARQRCFSKQIDIAAFYALPGEQKKIRTYHEGKPTLVSTFVPQTYTFTNRGIELTINGALHTYDIEEAEFRANFIGQSVTVRYEPDKQRWPNGCPPELLLYVQGAPLVWKGVHMAALPKEKYHMAVADYRPGEGAQLRAHRQLKKDQRSLVQARFGLLIEHTKANGTHTPMITANAFDKNVLQDTQAELLNQLIEGDNYSLTKNPPPTGEVKKHIDRLDDYDKPLPLE